MKEYKDKEWLYNEYVTKGRTMKSIAEPFGVDRKAIAYYIKKYEITSRSSGNIKGYNDITLKCGYCGNETIKTKGYLNKRKKEGHGVIFCTRECADKYHSNAMKGKNNPNYGGKWHSTPNNLVPKEILRDRGLRSVEKRRQSGVLASQIKKMRDGSLKYYSTEEGKKKRRLCGVASVLSQSGKRSSIERIISDELKKLNIKFEEQVRIGYWVADFYIPDYNLIIETHGDYWHGNPLVFDNLTPKQKKRKVMDKGKETYSRNRGYNYLILWEKDINSRLEWCVNQIKEAIRTVS